MAKRRRKYEVIVKVGPTVLDYPGGRQGLAWDKITTYLCPSLDAARDCKLIAAEKDPDAHIIIRDAETLQQAG